jgi:predicted TIM-barrel fold metal-dependent hydrolase
MRRCRSARTRPPGLPSLHHDRGRYWDPVFEAASECGLPLCTHFGSSSSLVKTSDETPMIATIAMNPTSLLLSTIDWLFSGILPRFPGLKICLSEGGLGWIPWVLQRSDYTLDRQRYWATSGGLEGDMLSGVGLQESGVAEALDYSIQVQVPRQPHMPVEGVAHMPSYSPTCMNPALPRSFPANAGRQNWPRS